MTDAHTATYPASSFVSQQIAPAAGGELFWYPIRVSGLLYTFGYRMGSRGWHMAPNSHSSPVVEAASP